jgi:hypothetical protein
MNVSARSFGVARLQQVRYHLAMTAEATRESLSQRVHRFVLVLERYKRNPNRREAYHVLSAIDCLKEERYEAGLESIRAAEHVEPIPDGVVLMRGLHDDITVGELREAFRKVVRSQDSSDF